MPFASLRDLRNLKVQVLHPANSEGEFLLDHLRRIGCTASMEWPIPDTPASDVDVVFLAIEDDARDEIKRFVSGFGHFGPTILAIVSYENPTALQMVLESGAMAVIERPIKPFGLLTNLAIARNSWQTQQSMRRDLRKFKRKVMGDKQVNRAKLILMAENGISEAEAHEDIRKMAMARQSPMEEVAETIIVSEGNLPKLLKRG